MKLVSLLVCVFVLLMVEPCPAQVQGFADEFRYDDSGNRIRRTYKIAIISLRQTQGEEYQVDTLVESLKWGQFAIKVYPNPTSDHIIIESSNWKQENSVTIKILDINGRVKHERLVTEAKERLFLETYTPGTYLVQYYLNSRLLSTWKIIKQ